MSKRLRQAAYLVEEPGLPQLGSQQFGMEELAGNQGGHRLEARKTRNDQLGGKSRVLPFDELHQDNHQTEIENFSSTNLQKSQVNMSEKDDRNTKDSSIGEDHDESQSKGVAVPSHVVIMVKPADDAVMNY